VEAYVVSKLTLSKNMSMTRARPSPLLKHGPDFRMELKPVFLKHAYWQLSNSLLAHRIPLRKDLGKSLRVASLRIGHSMSKRGRLSWYYGEKSSQ
jgi:hypothetical protein